MLKEFELVAVLEKIASSLKDSNTLIKEQNKILEKISSNLSNKKSETKSKAESEK